MLVASGMRMLLEHSFACGGSSVKEKICSLFSQCCLILQCRGLLLLGQLNPDTPVKSLIDWRRDALSYQSLSTQKEIKPHTQNQKRQNRTKQNNINTVHLLKLPIGAFQPLCNKSYTYKEIILQKYAVLYKNQHGHKTRKTQQVTSTCSFDQSTMKSFIFLQECDSYSGDLKGTILLSPGD